MKAKLNKILKDLIEKYDAVSDEDEQGRANALVLIQQALVNLQNFNNIELGNLHIAEAKREAKDK